MTPEPYIDTTLVKNEITKANDTNRPLYLIIIGTKPCYIKLASLILALHKANTPFLAVDAGQHYDKVLTSARQEFGFVHLISVHLQVRGTLTSRSALLVSRVEWLHDYLYQHLKLQTHAIPVVSGDTSTAGLFPVFWYLQSGIRSIHVEAGLRSMSPKISWEAGIEEVLYGQASSKWIKEADAPFPEGFDSRVASVGSQLFFAPISMNIDNLLAEGYLREDIQMSGSLSADALVLTKSVPVTESVFEVYPWLKEGKWLRVDVHRRENMRHDYLRMLLYALSEYIAKGGNAVFVQTNSVKAAFEQFGLQDLFQQVRKKGLRVTEHWPQYNQVIEFLRSENCAGVYTDSGGLQEESNLLGIPCATFRFTTDRPETIIKGKTNILVPPVSVTFITDALDYLFLRNTHFWEESVFTPLYGEKVGEKIADTLKNLNAKPSALAYLMDY